jgi:hypothetical protein
MAIRKVGRLHPKETVLQRLQSELLRNYAKDPEFMADLFELWDRYGRLIRALTSQSGKLWHADRITRPESAWLAARAVARHRVREIRAGEQRLMERTRMISYLAAVEDLAWRWGLRASWVAPRLHVAMAEPYVHAEMGSPMRPPMLTGMPLSASAWSSTRRITVSVEPDERETWKEVAARILKAGRQQWEGIRREMEQNSEWIAVDTRPELGKHITWLYQHICPQDGERWGWRKIAEAASVSPLAVRNAVLPLARELGIDLPALRAGRRRRT